jgi:hypothetical protein
MVCRFNPTQYVRRMREVGGLGFENAPRVTPLGAPLLPAIISLIDHEILTTDSWSD